MSLARAAATKRVLNWPSRFLSNCSRACGLPQIAYRLKRLHEGKDARVPAYDGIDSPRASLS